jgi:hypothetical protein
MADIVGQSKIFPFDAMKAQVGADFYSKTNQIHNFSNLFYFGTIHVLDGLSVHYQESKTVHTASGICHTCSVADC